MFSAAKYVYKYHFWQKYRLTSGATSKLQMIKSLKTDSGFSDHEFQASCLTIINLNR